MLLLAYSLQAELMLLNFGSALLASLYILCILFVAACPKQRPLYCDSLVRIHESLQANKMLIQIFQPGIPIIPDHFYHA